MEPKEVFSIIGGHVNEELLKRNQYLAAENEILRSKIKGRLKFTNTERIRLARLGKELGRKALSDLGPVVTPDTIQCVWGCVDPEHRHKGVWANLGEYNDELCRLSGAQMGIAWAATTHDLTQRAMEAVGYIPIGCFPGAELLGGSDGRYYRQNVIWYGKLYNEATKFAKLG